MPLMINDQPYAFEGDPRTSLLSGRAELHLADQIVILEAGNSWVVPKDAEHTYKILESFSAVEATSPPAQVHGRDDDK